MYIYTLLLTLDLWSVIPMQAWNTFLEKWVTHLSCLSVDINNSIPYGQKGKYLLE